MEGTETTQVLTSIPGDFVRGLRGFAAFVRNGGIEAEDVEMVAKRFEGAAAEIDRLRAESERLCAAVRAAQARFTEYGDLHAAKPDEVKAQRNWDMAQQMYDALPTS